MSFRLPALGGESDSTLPKSQAYLAWEAIDKQNINAKNTMTPVLKPRKAQIPDRNVSFGTGWLPPIYDPRDYTEKHPEIIPMTKKLKIPSQAARKPALPSKVDLRKYCSAIENQGGLGSCSAHAAAGIVEYFQK